MKDNKSNVNPIGLKGREINDRMKELMGITSINENKSNSVVELTKIGPDGKSYAIVRENHEYYIKVSEKTTNLINEDFKYIGGLQNKKSEAYGSYAKAIKHLNLNFKSLAEAYGKGGDINVFVNDKLITEAGAAGFSQYGGNGFSNEGNLEGNTPLFEEEEEETEEVTEGYDDEPGYDDVKGKPSKRWDADDAEDDEDDSIDEAIDEILNEGKRKNKLSIFSAMRDIDSYIDSIDLKKKK